MLDKMVLYLIVQQSFICNKLNYSTMDILYNIQFFQILQHARNIHFQNES